ARGWRPGAGRTDSPSSGGEAAGRWQGQLSVALSGALLGFDAIEQARRGGLAGRLDAVALGRFAQIGLYPRFHHKELRVVWAMLGEHRVGGLVKADHFRALLQFAFEVAGFF